MTTKAKQIKVSLSSLSDAKCSFKATGKYLQKDTVPPSANIQFIPFKGMHIYIRVCVCVCTYIYSICMKVHGDVWMYLYSAVYIYIGVFVCMCVGVCLCVCLTVVAVPITALDHCTVFLHRDKRQTLWNI